MLAAQQLCRKIPGLSLGKKKNQCSVHHSNTGFFCFLLYCLCSAWELGLLLEDAEFEMHFSPSSLLSVNKATNQSSAHNLPQKSTVI